MLVVQDGMMYAKLRVATELYSDQDQRMTGNIIRKQQEHIVNAMLKKGSWKRRKKDPPLRKKKWDGNQFRSHVPLTIQKQEVML